MAGRPELKEEKKTKYLKARLTAQEYTQIILTAKQLNLTLTELIRARVLKNNQAMLINAKEAIENLDHICAAINRVGNNINQIARLANSLKFQSGEPEAIIEKFNGLFESYIKTQRLLEATLRKIIRELAN